MGFSVPSGWKAVIGLEIHAQLATKSKMFSKDSTKFGAKDNLNVSPVSLGMPGALPVVNKKAIEYSIKAGLALGCKIRDNSVFARKHYFYPDLAKGYQISQYDLPICYDGEIEFLVNGKKKKVYIERAHMEEDAGKSIHDGALSLINYNRSSVPLLEIVSGPDMSLPEEAAEYTRTIRGILQYLEVCDGNLEEGSLRCDCNVSVMKETETKLRTRVEIKNINSFRFIEKAVEYEILRQIDTYEDGGSIFQETRLFDSAKNRTFTMRSKEEAKDYRYFRDPDLLPVKIEASWIEEIRNSLPELPQQRAVRFQTELGLPEYDSLVLTQEKKMADYFEAVVKKCESAKTASNWIMGELLKSLNEAKVEFEQNPIPAEYLAELIIAIENETISGKMAKDVFAEMWKSSKAPKSIIAEQGMSQITDPAAIEKVVLDVVNANQGQVEQYKAGKNKLFGFFVGQVMKQSKGQANPDLVNQILKKVLDT